MLILIKNKKIMIDYQSVFLINKFELFACLAQRSERRTCNAMVIGSTPIAGFFFYYITIEI